MASQLSAPPDKFKSKRPVVAPPVFIKASDLPRDIRNIDLLKQLEVIAGKGRAKVAQKISGLWRLHMADQEARLGVLRVGMTIRGKAIPTYDQNPNMYRDQAGNIIETTKLSIDGLPISISDEDLISQLQSMGVEFISNLEWANCRDADHSLRRGWYSGARYIYIKKPLHPLPGSIKIGHFKAFLHHQEQMAEIICSKCLEKGHKASNCKNQVVCLECKEKGHKKGDYMCPIMTKSRSAHNLTNNLKTSISSLFCDDCKEKGHVKGDKKCKWFENEGKKEDEELEDGELSDEDEEDGECDESDDSQKEEGQENIIKDVETECHEQNTVSNKEDLEPLIENHQPDNKMPGEAEEEIIVENSPKQDKNLQNSLQGACGTPVGDLKESQNLDDVFPNKEGELDKELNKNDTEEIQKLKLVENEKFEKNIPKCNQSEGTKTPQEKNADNPEMSENKESKNEGSGNNLIKNMTVEDLRALNESEVLKIINNVRLESSMQPENSQPGKKNISKEQKHQKQTKKNEPSTNKKGKNKLKTPQTSGASSPGKKKKEIKVPEDDKELEMARKSARPTRNGSIDFYLKQQNRNESRSGSRKRSNVSPLHQQRTKDIKISGI